MTHEEPDRVIWRPQLQEMMGGRMLTMPKCRDCGKFAHVFRASTLSKLPKGYNGELCKECACLMVAVEMLTPNA